MLETLLSFTAIALAAIVGSRVFRYLAVRFGQTTAFAAMAALLAIAFAVQTMMEKGGP